MSHYSVAGPGAMLLIHCMWVFGGIVAALGVYCIYKGIKEQFCDKLR